MESGFYFHLDRKADYARPPFHPPQNFPEFKGLFNEFDEQNRVYAMVRDLLIAARYDAEHIGTDKWNPFRGLIRNGELVVIKPNLAMEERGNKIGSHCIATNASLVRPILDYLFLLQATDGIQFRTVIGDVPIQIAVFEELVTQTGYLSVIDYFQKKHPFDLQLLDLRPEVALFDNHFITARVKQDGDPLGYTAVHLRQSYLDEIIKDYRKFSAIDYDGEQTTGQHAQKGYHYYSIANTVLNCDLFINLSKIKTHQKAGVTLALKNLVGVNGDKSWIPHYRMGAISMGGDEFSQEYLLLKYVYTVVRRFLQERSRLLWNIGKWGHKHLVLPLVHWSANKRQKSKQQPANNRGGTSNPFITDGAWYGNDTLWRPILDLNNLLLFSDKSGTMRSGPPRRCLCFGDGIIAGEGDGPLNATPKNTGLVTLSENPVVHDICCARLMGFDWQKIPQLRHSITLDDGRLFDGDPNKLSIIGLNESGGVRHFKYEQMPNLGFRSAPGWSGHIELNTDVS
ncbi:MAG: DUF362 domain-containing protein [bacterium]